MYNRSELRPGDWRGQGCVSRLGGIVRDSPIKYDTERTAKVVYCLGVVVSQLCFRKVHDSCAGGVVVRITNAFSYAILVKSC